MAFIYDAFISYSHRDMDSAKWLQRRLESYRIPKSLCERGERGSHLRAFRDQTDLAGVELQQALRSELDSAEYLIVVCSPDSAASHWVNDEIEYFISKHDADHVIPFIVDGEPESEDPELECYPPMLRSIDGYHFLGANVQELGKNKAFLKLLSILLDVRFNRLVDRDKQRRLRTGVIVGSLGVAIVVSLSCLLFLSVLNKAMSYRVYAADLISLRQPELMEPKDIIFLKRSAEAGNTDAIFFLACCYRSGWGTEEDPDSAFRWFRTGAEAGDPLCMIGLSNCYSNGIGTVIDKEQAFFWDLSAANTGNPEGMFNTAIAYEDGLGTEIDEKDALEWYQKSADAGYDLALYNLARCYMAGIGTDQDPQKAFDCMSKLAETGNTDAMYNLAMMYQEGYGTEEDPRQAFLWYRKAAIAGDANAMYWTGWCIENGYGTEGEALDWYLLAEANGNEEASEAIARITGN